MVILHIQREIVDLDIDDGPVVLGRDVMLSGQTRWERGTPSMKCSFSDATFRLTVLPGVASQFDPSGSVSHWPVDKNGVSNHLRPDGRAQPEDSVKQHAPPAWQAIGYQHSRRIRRLESRS